MEAAGIYGIASELGAKALTICTVTDHILRREQLTSNERQTTLNEMNCGFHIFLRVYIKAYIYSTYFDAFYNKFLWSIKRSVVCCTMYWSRCSENLCWPFINLNKCTNDEHEDKQIIHQMFVRYEWHDNICYIASNLGECNRMNNNLIT